MEKNQLMEITLTPPLDKMPKVNHGFYEKRGKRIHGGIDLGCKVGTEVKSVADGKVTAAGSLDAKCGDGVSVEHAEGFKSSYCHLSDVKVKVGDSVKQGQIIGLSGGRPGAPGAGNSKGPHLHLTLKKDGVRVDPLDYIDRAVSPPDVNYIEPIYHDEDAEENPKKFSKKIEFGNNSKVSQGIFSDLSPEEARKFLGDLLQTLSTESLKNRNDIISETLRIRELMK